MDTNTLKIKTLDGKVINLLVPNAIPSSERADYLGELWETHVRLDDGHWKGRVSAIVSRDLGDDVAEAMEFSGALIDHRSDSVKDGKEITVLTSRGYWAHGF